MQKVTKWFEQWVEVQKAKELCGQSVKEEVQEPGIEGQIGVAKVEASSEDMEERHGSTNKPAVFKEL